MALLAAGGLVKPGMQARLILQLVQVTNLKSTYHASTPDR